SARASRAGSPVPPSSPVARPTPGSRRRSCRPPAQPRTGGPTAYTTTCRRRRTGSASSARTAGSSSAGSSPGTRPARPTTCRPPPVPGPCRPRRPPLIDLLPLLDDEVAGDPHRLPGVVAQPLQLRLGLTQHLLGLGQFVDRRLVQHCVLGQRPAGTGHRVHPRLLPIHRHPPPRVRPQLVERVGAGGV